MKIYNKSHRILNTHKNVPGILSTINSLMSGINILGQTLGTLGDVGYIIIDVDREVSEEGREKLKQMSNSIKTRILY